MALPATDTFTALDGTPLTTYSANWTLNLGNFTIQTNQLTSNAADAECGAHWDADVFSADQYAQATLVSLQVAAAMGVAVRCNITPDDYYYGVYSDSSTIYLFEVTNGSFGELDSASAPASGSVIKMTVIGTTGANLKVYDDTVEILSASDGSLTSGAAGVSGYGAPSTSRIDNWEGGNVGGGAVNITAAEDNQAQKSDTAVLGVYIPVAPSQQNQTQVSDLASLSLATTALTAAEDNQAQASDAASLTFAGPTFNITAAENNQAQVSDIATFGVIISITAADANQAQISDAATLGVWTPITPSQQNQAQVSDAAVLGVYTPITAAECNQAQITDLAIIQSTEITNITVAENNQAQVSDLAELTYSPPWYQAYWTTVFNQNQECWVTLTNIVGKIQLWGRMVNPTGGGVDLRGYYAEYSAGTVTAHRYNDATSTNEGLGTADVTLSNGDKLWMRLEDDNVQVYTYSSSAWTQRIDVTDPAPALEGGYIGFAANSADARLDDFGGGNLVITAAENNQGQASDAATLGVWTPIVPSQQNQAQVSDAVSLGAISPVTGAENNQAQVSDIATLGVITPISAAEANQAQVSDAVSLTAEAPTIPLTADDNNQAQVSDAVTFSSIVYPITAEENNQAQVSDAAIITSGEVSITAADNRQAQVSDAVTISAYYPITAGDNNQAQVSDAVTFGVIHPITAAENNQAQVSDAASITFSGGGAEYNITVTEDWQAQVSDAATLGVYTPIAASQQNQAQASDAASITASGPIYSITAADNWQAQAVDIPGLGVVYVVDPGQDYQAQVSDLAVLSLTGVFEHGERRLYQFDARGSSVFTSRGTSVFATRTDLEVND